jgi:IS605 OrfB family transposase
MTTLTYVKGLPTPEAEMNILGFTDMEMFLEAFAPIFRLAAIDTVNMLLSGADFSKSQWNTYLQRAYNINKRHANGVIAYAKGKVDGAKEHRTLHLKTLEGKVKSLSTWIKKAERRLVLARKFYKKKNWKAAKTGCNFPMSCSLKFRDTNFSNLEFQIHGKKRKLYKFQQQIQHLKAAAITVSVPHDQVFIVGSKGEAWGNQAAQYDGTNLKVRVPACLEDRFGKYVSTAIGNYDRKINRLPKCDNSTAKTWHIFRKDGAWKVAVQFTPVAVKPAVRHSSYGCIGIDMNPGSIGWAYVDCDGNLKAKGQIPLQMGVPNGQQQAQIVEACLAISTLALAFECPVICEELDFATKKQQLGEKAKRYARMLSSWAHAEFFTQLRAILTNRGIYLKTVNPAYTSIIGLVKYMRMYGLSSDTAAALVMARRGMRLAENIPGSITAYSEVNSEKHVWSQWNQLNKQISASGKVSRRHDYFTISNWSFLANQHRQAE